MANVMKKQGKIKIVTTKKGNEIHCIELQNKKGNLYDHTAQDYKFEKSLNGKECEVELIDGKISKITVDGKIIPSKAGTKPHKKPGAKAPGEGNPGVGNDSLNISQTCLPNDVRNSGISDIDNFYLKFFKAARFDGDNGHFKYIQTDKKGIKHLIKPDFGATDFNYLCSNMAEAVKTLPGDSKRFKFTPRWRMVVGLGNGSVYETSMTLHHVYGFPFIPGSALKGVVRSAVIVELFESKEEKALKDKGFCDIFGCPEKSAYKEARKGNVIFLDSFPLEKPNIVPDVMTPHYHRYYGGPARFPTDDQSPNIIQFLVVQQTPFQFLISSENNKRISEGVFSGKTVLEAAEEWIKKALTDHGIGAKTASGYGMGDVVNI